ncbi:MAG: rod shape-determining protein MreC [Proteobacteria bacterium]|nr:rod shape-determining protein MreC [Pseudomonadota bacterium]
MKARTEAVFRFAAPLKAAMARFAFLSLVAASFALMLLGKAEVVVVERVRMALLDVLAPVFGVISQPAEAVAGAVGEVGQVVHVYQENRQLREQVARLEQWQEAARRLDTENQALRALLNFRAGPETRQVTGRVMGDSGGAFVRSILVAAGAEQGVAKGQAAMTGEGLVGRVSEVGERSARVLLITDLNSRIPVVIERSRERAVLAGDNTARPRLLYLSPDARLSPGDRVSTSGHGGALPPGLPIGVVAEVGERGVLIQPYADWARLDYVRLLDYGLTGILPSLPAPPPAKSSRK